MSTASTARVASRLLARAAANTGKQPGTELDRFEPLSLAGRGTFAEVWQVRDRQTGQIRALKQLRDDQGDLPAARRILANEAEVSRRISSTHVVKLCEAALDNAPPFVLMEWLSGRTLEACLGAEQRLSCHDAIWIGRQCAQGMHAMLVAGFCHGDVKPSNIFVCDDGVVKLIDLGFSRPDQQPTADIAQDSRRTLTGTPEYMAPEALAPGDPGGISRDIYSLGVTLYRMLTGSLPFQGETVASVLKQHQQSVAPRLRSLAPEVPREVNDFVHRLLSKQPLRRGGGLSWLVGELVRLELLVMSDG